MRRIRWGRIALALGGLGLAINDLPYVPLWLTRPTVGPPTRVLARPDAASCRTGERLLAEKALERAPGADDLDAPDPAGLAIALDAARCTELSAIPSLDGYVVFSGVNHGLAALDPEAHPAGALDSALAVWELAADQRRAGPLFDVALWTGIALKAADVVDRALLHGGGLPDATLAETQDRLTRIAAADFSWTDAVAREELELWTWVPHLAHSWGFTPLAWRILLDARRTDSPMLDILARTDREMRTRAATLASTAEMERIRRETGACPTAGETTATLAHLDLDLDWLADRCVVVGAFEGGAAVGMVR